jgi:hypothetical protein
MLTISPPPPRAQLLCQAASTATELDVLIEQLVQRKRSLEQDTEEASLEVRAAMGVLPRAREPGC